MTPQPALAKRAGQRHRIALALDRQHRDDGNAAEYGMHALPSRCRRILAGAGPNPTPADQDGGFPWPGRSAGAGSTRPPRIGARLTAPRAAAFDPCQTASEDVMERRMLGRTGLEVSALGFGCGAVGGLMVRGDAGDQERAVARALELGINYFDTAAMYGNGESERNLGRVLKSLKPEIYVGTKVRVPGRRDAAGSAAAIAASMEASLQRLQLDQRRSVPAAQPHHSRRRRWRLSARNRAGRGGAGVRAAARRKGRRAFSGSPRSATPRHCTRSSTAVPSTPRRSATTRSIQAPGRRCRPATRRMISAISWRGRRPPRWG